jgi:hypothetical protein
MNSTIDPLKGYNEGQLRELLNLKKRYTFAALYLVLAEAWVRTHTSASRWYLRIQVRRQSTGLRRSPTKSRGEEDPRDGRCRDPLSPRSCVAITDPASAPASAHHQCAVASLYAEKANRARQKFDESRTAYFNRLVHSQDDENEHVAQLQAYAAAQAIYFRRCAELYDSLTRDLTTLTARAPDRPRLPPMTLTYTDQTAATVHPPAHSMREAGTN